MQHLLIFDKWNNDKMKHLLHRDWLFIKKTHPSKMAIIKKVDTNFDVLHYLQPTLETRSCKFLWEIN
jgi:hypothetical protein